MRTRSDHHARAGLPRAMRFGFVLIVLGAVVELARHLAAPPHTVNHHASSDGGLIVLAGMLLTTGGLIAQAFDRRPDGPERRN